jgi:hypothetical protein
MYDRSRKDAAAWICFCYYLKGRRERTHKHTKATSMNHSKAKMEAL